MQNTIIKLLLIEDNPADVAFIEEMLHNASGYTYVLTNVSSLAEGIELLKANTFSLIISDISLPDNDGLENIDKIKAIAPLLAIIILTGLNDIEAGTHAVEKGAQDYLVKGQINTDLLVRSINYAIKRKNNEQKFSVLNKKLSDIVLYDSLTGIINRRPFIDSLERNIKRAKRVNEKLGVLFLDFENFKQVNDVHGHETGDKTLIEAVNIINKEIRGCDFFGRFGGDEFVICLGNSGLSGATRVAKKINDLFSEKLIIDGLMLDLGVSIGIAIFPDDGKNVTDLLKNSDLAMYKSKKLRKNSFHPYSKTLRSEMYFNLALQNALENKEFKINFQAIVDRYCKPIFMETLLRWENPDFGNVPPMDFIPILEKNRFIVEVGEWVFREACRKAKVANDLSQHQIHVSVNISQYQIEDEFFVDKISNIVKETNIEPSRILLEITEKNHIKNTDKVKKTMLKLKEIGIGLIALDDFGAGYSSFSNLIRFPLDIVKIDNFFVEKLEIAKYRKITLNLISLIKNYDLKVIAEGVETREQFEFLAEMGCDYFQGFYFSEPQADINSILNITQPGI